MNPESAGTHRTLTLNSSTLAPTPYKGRNTRLWAADRDILDDLLHEDGIGQHVRPEGNMLKQQAEQLAHNRQLLRRSSVHPQTLQHQPEDSRQEGQDGDTNTPQLVPTVTERKMSP